MWKEDKNLLDKLREVIEGTQQKNKEAATNELFFHYTNSTGLLGILQTNRLWATHFSFLNDMSEFEYGVDVIFKVLDEYLKTQELDETNVQLITSVFRLQKSLEFDHYNAYISCFCTNGDLLSQWRGYAGSSGYAIGFSGELFNNQDYINELRNSTNIQWVFGKVYYGNDAEELAREIIPHCVEIVKSYLIEFPLGLIRDGNMEIIPNINCLRWLFFDIPFFSKHDGFREEMEWRLVGTPKGIPSTKYRATTDGLIPYVEFKFSEGLFTIDPVKDFPAEYINEDGMPKRIKETPFSRKEYKEMYDNMWLMGPSRGRVNYIDTIIIGPTSNFETQKYALEDLIKQLAHKAIYPDMMNSVLNSENTSSIYVGENYSYYCKYPQYLKLPKVCQSKIPFKS